MILAAEKCDAMAVSHCVLFVFLHKTGVNPATFADTGDKLYFCR